MVKIKFLEDEQRDIIGFNYILEKIDVITPYGINEKKKIRPFQKKENDLLINELENSEKIIESIKKYKDIYLEIDKILYKLKDIRNTVKRCKNSSILDEVELYELKYFALLMEELLVLFNLLNIKIDNIKINELKEVVAILDPENKKISTFYIYDLYSLNLKKIREDKRNIEKQIFKETDMNLVNKLKETRLDLVILEEKEEFNIKKHLSQKLSSYMSIVEVNMNSLGRLDLLIAKGKFFIHYEAIKPQIVNDEEIELIQCYNPKINDILEIKGKKFVPISINLKSGTTVITGANMGGKSVSLNTIVLNLLLAQMGFFVFCKEAKIPILDFIYLICDDMQSISKGLSTFGAEIVKLKEVVACIKNGKGFVALDEFARGTNPKEGSILVKSLCKYLRDFKTISVISTHYDGIVDEDTVHYQVVGLKNINFEALKYKIDLNKKNSIQIIQEYMDYKLERVSVKDTVPKDALNISILLGIEDDIVSIAKEYYEKREFYGE